MKTECTREISYKSNFSSIFIKILPEKKLIICRKKDVFNFIRGNVEDYFL